MARLIWDEASNKYYETGTSNGVLYPQGNDGNYQTGVNWNGLISVKHAPDGAEGSPIYANNKKYLEMTSAENFKGTIDAYTYPDEFMACDGSKEIATGVYAGQQNRQSFGLSYVTIVGNDTEGNDFGKKFHIIYGAKVAPSSRDYETINGDPNALQFSWEFTTTPAELSDELEVQGFKPTAYICIDGTKLQPETVKKLQDKLWGTETDEPTLPAISELVALVTEV